MPFREPCPALISPNPGGAEDPLGESVLDPEQPAVRVFEPRDRRLIIGRHQDPQRELLVAQARGDGVPIHRRATGGGAVVLAPGMCVIALRLIKDRLGVDCYFERVNQVLVPAVQELVAPRVVCRGHGDLALVTEQGERKILGASMRQTRDLVVYLGVLLHADAVPLMERYLAAPSRQPSYRAARGHRAFCTHLGAHGVTFEAMQKSVRCACQAMGAI